MSTRVKLFSSKWQAGAPALVTGNESDVANVLRGCLVTGFALSACTITVANGVATVNTSGAQHGQIQHGVALIEGCAVAAMNGQHRVATVVSPNEFTLPAPAGVPSGTLAATGAQITQRVAPAGWEEAFGAGTKIFRSAELQGPRHFVHVGGFEYRSDAEYPYGGQIIKAYTDMQSANDIDAGLANPYANVNLTIPTSLGNDWWLIASPSGFYLSTGAAGNGMPGPFAWFGEFASVTGDRPGWASCISQTIAGFTYNNWQQQGGALHQHLSDLVIAGSPLSGGLGGILGKQISERSRATFTVASGQDSSFAWPQQVGGALVLSRPLVVLGNDFLPQMLGHLPGMYHIPQQIQNVNWDAPVLIDGTGPLAGRKLLATLINWGTAKPSLAFDITGPW
jgi:hypothetical protein